jgi:Zn ribbon nucleic-acid-binding protein
MNISRRHVKGLLGGRTYIFRGDQQPRCLATWLEDSVVVVECQCCKEQEVYRQQACRKSKGRTSEIVHNVAC